jgi:hypothetical protein
MVKKLASKKIWAKIGKWGIGRMEKWKDGKMEKWKLLGD